MSYFCYVSSTHSVHILSLFKADSLTCKNTRDRSFNSSFKSKTIQCKDKKNMRLGLKRLYKQLEPVLRSFVLVKQVTSSLRSQAGIPPVLHLPWKPTAIWLCMGSDFRACWAWMYIPAFQNPSYWPDIYLFTAFHIVWGPLEGQVIF